MKKILSFTLAALVLLTALTSCRMPEKQDPFKEILEENPEMELPKSEVMEVDPEDAVLPRPEQEFPPVDTGEDGRTIELAVDDGTFVFKESPIYDFKGNNLVVAEMTNNSESNYNIIVHTTYYDEFDQEVFSESREYRYLAAGYTQNIVFLPMKPFAYFEYTIEAIPYDGVCFGLLHSLEFNEVYEGISNIGRKMYPTLWASMIENNANSAKFFREATLILFDNTGEVYGLYYDCLRHVDIKLQDIFVGNVGGIMGKLYVHTANSPIEWPEELVGDDVSGIIVPYYATWSSDLYYLSDANRICPEQDFGYPDPWPGSYRQDTDIEYD